MAAPKKVPYYRIESSPIPFVGPRWKEYKGSEGCVPLNTQTSVSMDRLAPGEQAPLASSTPPKLTHEQMEFIKAKEKALADGKKWSENQATMKAKNDVQPKEKAPEPVDEECENPPIFDMLDIPDAMEKMKWPVSAKIARKWFSSPNHIYDDDQTSIQPIDDSTVTLDWALKFGGVEKKFDALLAEDIYTERSFEKIKKKTLKKIYELFVNQKSAALSFNTSPAISDIRQFHIDYQFQLTSISSLNTMDGTVPNDLTGTLGSFAICVALGNATVSGDKYVKYDNKTGMKTFCFDPKVEITHVYAYIKDSYSFNDETGSKKSQYLGHWNNSGLILSHGAAINGLMGSTRAQFIGIDNTGNYLFGQGFDKPVDARRGTRKKFRDQDVYFPIYNKSYNEWRKKHNRGGDFMIYSQPRYMKLKKPIAFTLETLCRPPEKL